MLNSQKHWLKAGGDLEGFGFRFAREPCQIIGTTPTHYGEMKGSFRTLAGISGIG